MRALAVIPSGLLAGLLIAIATVSFEPQWFLTTRTVSKAVRFFGAPIHPRWNNLAFDIRSVDFWTKEISLRAADFCFEKPDVGVEGCIKSLDVRFTLRLFLLGGKITKISTFAVAGDHLTLDTTIGPPIKFPESLPAPLRGVAVENLEIEMPANKIVGAKITATVNLHAEATTSAPLAVNATLDNVFTSPAPRARVQLSLTSDILRRGLLFPVNARGSFSADDVNGNFDIQAAQAGSAVAIKVAAEAKRRDAWLRVSAQGLQTHSRYTLAGTAAVRQPSGPLRRLDLASFKIEALRGPGSWRPESFLWDCHFRIEPMTFRWVKGLRRPEAIEGTLSARALMTPSLRQKDHFNADISVALNPYKEWYEFRGGLRAKASGRLSSLKSVALSQNTDFTLKVAHFEDVVSFLAETRYAVPAPLNVLKGPLALSVHGRGDPRGDRQEFAYESRGDLSAAKQKLKLRMTGKLVGVNLRSTTRSFENVTEVILEDVALQAPHLDALRMPAMKLDPRIKSLKQKERDRLATQKTATGTVAVSTAALRLSVHAVTAKPIVFYSDLAKTPIPVSFDLNFTTPPEGTAGTVSVGPMQVEFFRRPALIDHINFGRGSGEAAMELDGLVVYKTDDAVIRLRLLGTVEKPRVEFESEPAMSQPEIIALLLYGKPPDDLDALEKSSVANTQTAMANEAFGLASLYLFASTPIQYVGYDEPTRAYTARFRVPGGETLELNSDFVDASQVQLSKRLARHLEIRAQASNTREEGNAVTTLLEWFNRY